MRLLWQTSATSPWPGVGAAPGAVGMRNQALLYPYQVMLPRPTPGSVAASMSSWLTSSVVSAIGWSVDPCAGQLAMTA